MQCVETIQGLPKLERAWLRNSPDHKLTLTCEVVKTIDGKLNYGSCVRITAESL